MIKKSRKGSKKKGSSRKGSPKKGSSRKGSPKKGSLLSNLPVETSLMNIPDDLVGGEVSGYLTNTDRFRFGNTGKHIDNFFTQRKLRKYNLKDSDALMYLKNTKFREKLNKRGIVEITLKNNPEITDADVSALSEVHTSASVISGLFFNEK